MITIRSLPEATVYRAELDSRPETHDSGYVLAKLPDTHACPWVTWYVAKNHNDADWDAYNGHYFQTWDEAVANFDDRRKPALERIVEPVLGLGQSESDRGGDWGLGFIEPKQ